MANKSVPDKSLAKHSAPIFAHKQTELSLATMAKTGSAEDTNLPTTGELIGWPNRIVRETSNERTTTLILGTTFAFWGWMAINIVELRGITAQMDVRLTVVEKQLVELREDTYNRFEKIETRIDDLDVRLTALEKKLTV